MFVNVAVLDLGVAGLEAVATAHRLGAAVEGYDVRPATGEQARSLGATFVDTGVDARGSGGYARELTAAEKITVDAVLHPAGKGYSGVVNGLFSADNTFMVDGDAAAVLGQMIEAVKGLGAAAA